jgi:hypothetical protein
VSLAVAFKASEGIVLAADSRVTLTVGLKLPGNPNNWLVPATYDNATKLLTVSGQKYVAASTYGAGAIGLQEPRTAHSLLPEFEANLDPNRLSVEDFAKKLSDFFADQWKAKMPVGATADDMCFTVAAYFRVSDTKCAGSRRTSRRRLRHPVRWPERNNLADFERP